MHTLFGNGRCLASGLHDVSIVRQEDDVFGRRRLYGLQDLAHARVHGVAAREDTRRADAPEHRLYAIASRHGHYGRGGRRHYRRGLLPPLGVELAVLLIHALYLDLAERPQRYRETDDRPGVFDVDVHLQRRRVAYHHGRARHLVHSLPHAVRVQPLSLDEQLRAVAELFLLHSLEELVGHRTGVLPNTDGVWRLKLLFQRCLARGPRAQPLEDDEHPVSAGVHNAGLAQHRQHGGSERHGAAGGFAYRLEQSGHVGGVTGFEGSVGGVAQHRQHRALPRLPDRPVSEVASELQGVCELSRAEVLGVVQPRGESLEELGQYHAAVALCAPESAAGHRGGNLVSRNVLTRGGLRKGVSQRKVHVGAGVPVGNGKDVQPVEEGDVELEQLGGGGEHRAQVIAIAAGLGSGVVSHVSACASMARPAVARNISRLRPFRRIAESDWLC